MKIRRRAELDALYPQAQEGIRYDSPELLLMRYISGQAPVFWRHAGRGRSLRTL